MLRKVTSRLRWAVVVCAMAGVAVGAGGWLFSSFAQGDGYFCPPQYQTCSDSGWGEYSDTPSEGGLGGGVTNAPCDNRGGVWKCTGATNSTGLAGGTCTNAGCKQYSSDYPVWVCAYKPSDKETRCPPMDACECR
jgi:hypothetical protein